MQSLSEYLDIFVRVCAVYACMFVLFILNIISVSAPLSITIDVPFMLMTFYYWSIYRPTLIPPALVFSAGICLDLLSGWPVGLNAFIFLVLRHNVASQRIFLTGQPFMVIWFGYMIVGSGALFMQWLLFGLMRLQWNSLEPVFLSAFISILIFPIISLVLHLSHKILPEIQGQYSAVT
tara:strand:- start:25584 stop:26117 length:534 start_codon:yes stop_codon:yes gene_type:complete